MEKHASWRLPSFQEGGSTSLTRRDLLVRGMSAVRLSPLPNNYLYPYKERWCWFSQKNIWSAVALWVMLGDIARMYYCDLSLRGVGQGLDEVLFQTKHELHRRCWRQL